MHHRPPLPLAVLPLALLLLLGQAPTSSADATTFLATQLAAAADPAGCGELGAPCCLRREQRCGGASNLACVALEASEPRCIPCGGAGEPPCAGECRLTVD